MLRYLDDWLILAPSEAACPQVRDQVLQLCAELGILVNLEKSSLTPTQSITYLGIDLDSLIFKASPTRKRIDGLRKLVEEFLSFEWQPADLWRSLLGHLSSMTQLVPGARLRMRSLKLILKRSWDFLDPMVLIRWNQECQEDLLWFTEDRLLQGISLLSFPPTLHFWSDASDQG